MEVTTSPDAFLASKYDSGSKITRSMMVRIVGLNKHPTRSSSMKRRMNLGNHVLERAPAATTVHKTHGIRV